MSIRVVARLLLAALVVSSGAHGAIDTETLPLTGMGEDGEKPVHWDFRLEAGRGAGAWTRIRVPSCWEQEGFGAYFYGGEGRGKPDRDPTIPKERGEYRTEFEAPAHWRGRHVRIVFEGVMTDTRVFINGKSAGPTHQGGFYRFHYDIGALLRFGEKNRLDVIVDKESAHASVNRAERRGDYWTFGGVYRPVWLESRPAQHIDWTAIDAKADGAFYARVHLGGVAPGSYVHAEVFDENGAPVGPRFSARTSAAGAIAVVRGKIDKPRTWSAETPNLYRAKFTLAGPGDGEPLESRVLHEIVERFGFRTFEVRPQDGLYLNGRKIVLKGVNRHSFAPDSGRTLTRVESERDVRLMKEANMNAVRMAHYPPDAHFLEAADAAGLYVLNELAGWQGAYDTGVGARLIAQMVRRDANHPSILFWSNGNEGGWNGELDGEFDRWDAQRRPVLHPWALHSGVNTDHYETYESTVKLSRGPDIFMPTEFLHGLYDGGLGAGLRDYWDVMSASPSVAGGFLWAWADEGVARTDRDGRIDTNGNQAPDGMLGPRGEKEGSFYAVKEIWSPVQIGGLRLDEGQSALRMRLSNRFAFTNLDRCTFAWRALRLPPPGGSIADQHVIAAGEAKGPQLQTGEQAEWALPIDLGAGHQAHVVQLTVKDPQGRELWTWSVRIPERAERVQPLPVSARAAPSAADGDRVIIASAPYELAFDARTGELVEVRKDGVSSPLGRGPRLIAYKRVERRFADVSGSARLERLQAQPRGSDSGVLAVATYDGPLRKVTWSRRDDALAMSYEIAYEDVVDILGVRFDVPEAQIASKRWVGQGPYRIWRNRLEGGVFGFHETPYNDPIPGETYAYPEFKGYFGEWRWLTLETRSGAVTARNDGAVPFFGLYAPRGGVSPVLELPDIGWSFLHVVPAMGTKFDLPDVLGPQSQPHRASGKQRGEVTFTFGTSSRSE